ncbi:MAG: pantetheine-phosphate adenylyltransferase [Pseudobdellovibrionaceae bacterium]|jgi:pantetheine-phosphate adenylyltransferase
MRAVYPGSFDPIHLGHIDVIERMSKRFEEVIVLISHSGEKSQMFTPQERKALIEASLAHIKNVRVDIHSGLTVDYLKQHGASTIVRGLRAVVDFEYEMTMASMNRKLNPEIETLLMFASPERYYISSRGVKEVAKFGGNLESLVTPNVIKALHKKLGTDS